MSRILITDCGNGPPVGLQADLERRGHEILTARDSQAALACLAREAVKLVIVKACRSCPDSLETVRSIRRARSAIPMILVTARSAPEEVIEALALGVFNCYVTPFDGRHLLAGIEQALGSMEARVAASVEEPRLSDSSMLVGASSVMQMVYSTIGRVARTDAPVLISGEPGTGKELAARCVHRYSRRFERPLVTANLAGMAGQPMECELFGSSHDGRDALHRATGKVAYAHTGTLLLLGVESLPLALQAKLLGVLEQQVLERPGGDEVRVDVRILATTSEDLGDLVGGHQFREDLYRRLNVVTVRMPPLRDRREDIPQLAQCLLHRFAARLGLEAGCLTSAAIEALCRHAWPGNLRELEQCVQRVLIRAHGQTIQVEDVEWALEADKTCRGDLEDQRLLGVLRDYLGSEDRLLTSGAFLDKIERMLIVEALHRSRGNRSRAATLLGLPRPTLHAKMERHRIQVGQNGPETAPRKTSSMP